MLVLGGGPGALTAGTASRLPGPDALLATIAADGGLLVADALGLRVDLVVGDLDSAPELAVEAAIAAGADVERHPREKDATDLELALDRAQRLEPERIVVVGSPGGRLDHLLGTAMLLASPRLGSIDVVAHLGDATVHVVHGGSTRTVTGRRGDLVSLVPVHAGAFGVRTSGMRYPLHGEDLAVGATRGVSNELDGAPASVALAGGTALVILPGPEGPS